MYVWETSAAGLPGPMSWIYKLPIYIYIYIWLYVCICVYLYLCVQPTNISKWYSVTKMWCLKNTHVICFLLQRIKSQEKSTQSTQSQHEPKQIKKHCVHGNWKGNTLQVELHLGMLPLATGTGSALHLWALRTATLKDVGRLWDAQSKLNTDWHRYHRLAT